MNGPDLICTNLTIYPDSSLYNVTSSILFNATVTNIGTDIEPYSYYYLGFSVDDVNVVTSYNYFNLTPNTSIVYTGSWTPTPGDHHNISCTADYYNYLRELSKTNNVLTLNKSFYVNSPDLMVSNVWMSGNSSVYNNYDTITLYANVTNIGNSPMPYAYFYTEFDIDDVNIATPYIYAALMPNDSVIVSYVWHATSGHKGNLTVKADVYSYIADLNRTNNRFDTSINLTILPPDLIVSNITLIPASPITGDNVTIIASITNIGVAQTSNGFYTLFTVDGTALYYYGDYYSGYILPNQTINVTSSAKWNALRGIHNITIIADSSSYSSYNNTMIESNETNNAYNLSIIVYSAPIIQNYLALPRYPNIHTDVNVSANITDVDGVDNAALYYMLGGILNNNYASNALGASIYDYSSNYGSSWDVSNLISNDTSTNIGSSWASLTGNTANQWVIIKLNGSQLLNKIVLFPYSDETSARWTKDFRIAVSNGGTQDSDFVMVGSGTAPNNVASPINITFNARQVSFIKVYFDTNWGDANYIEANKIQAYAPIIYTIINMTYNNGNSGLYAATIPSIRQISTAYPSLLL